MPEVSTTQAVAGPLSFHGVFMEVRDLGVLIKGDPAIGKSELALELISRGHRLVADDIVDFFLLNILITVHSLSYFLYFPDNSKYFF